MSKRSRVFDASSEEEVKRALQDLLRMTHDEIGTEQLIEKLSLNFSQILQEGIPEDSVQIPLEDLPGDHKLHMRDVTSGDSGEGESDASSGPGEPMSAAQMEMFALLEDAEDLDSEESSTGAGEDQPQDEYEHFEIPWEEVFRHLVDVFDLEMIEDIGGGHISVTTWDDGPQRSGGPSSDILIYETVHERAKRKAVERRAGLPSAEWTDEDVQTTVPHEETNLDAHLHIYFVADKSGSMSNVLWLLKFAFAYFLMLTVKMYGEGNVTITLVRTDIKAKQIEVNDWNDFWRLKASGGTHLSSGPAFIQEDLARNRRQENRVAIMVSDGENFSVTDDQLCVDLINSILGNDHPIHRFLYIQTDPKGRGFFERSLGRAMKRDRLLSAHPRFLQELLACEKDMKTIVEALCKMVV